MTDAERALIEECLSADGYPDDLKRSKVVSLSGVVAAERIGAPLLAELKQKLRAKFRAERECNAAWSKVPRVAQHALNSKFVDEIYAEEGWE